MPASGLREPARSRRRPAPPFLIAGLASRHAELAIGKGYPPTLLGIVEPYSARIKCFRIKGAPKPGQHALVLRMPRIGDGLQELLVATGPTAILRGASAGPSQTARVLDFRSPYPNRLKGQVVLPAVAEVVLVRDPIADLEMPTDRDLPSRQELRVVLEAVRIRDSDLYVLTGTGISEAEGM